MLKLRANPRAVPIVRRDRPDEGLVAVPVISTRSSRSGFLWYSSSSSVSKPALTIAPEGLRFRIVLGDAWPYADIEQVDVRKALFGGLYLLFVRDGGHRVLTAHVRDADAVQQALAALPRSVPLSAAAAIARDGSADAATPGLKRYRGRR